ncbi:TRAP transporter, DctM subunit [Tistlia consotensis]|uniref:TRAP transporter large permease protein n=1 Tax=Tistlia consotensis USBA 355 TaxID=560819 RepID=A0A1Y6BJ06_9PROT|nr:TRAP transporter large permease [Tistlia consotensis]SMF13858.1 TRAP transporter, DctM subunit [Tistlia consotensis USBA 355]SNR50120.1 TRAP transporter, DctM subunit [Tistlia consotensis]
MTLLLLGLFLGLLLVGAPIAVAMGLSAAVVILTHHLPVAVLAQRSVNALDSSPLLAVPLFIFAANLLNAAGVTGHLFQLIRLLVGRIRGGVAQVSVLVNLVFSGISGAALADIGALGSIQMRMMREQGYRDEFAAGVTMAAATIGPIFPPSIPIIIFAAAANVSAVKLLLAGIVPALIIAVLLMLQIAVTARLKGLPRDAVRPDLKEIARTFLVSLPALLAPVLLIGGLLSGYFGPTEVAGVTVAYALAIGSLVYRQLTWRSLLAAARETVEATASVLFIVAAAALFAWVLTVDRVPANASGFLLGLSRDPLVLLLILNGLLLVVGMVLESLAAILIIAPIVTPALVAAGVDPIQLGVVFVLNLMIGLLTPPVGMSLYMVAIVAKLPLHRVVVGVLPFLIPLLLSLLVVTLVPAVATWLPNLVIK